MDLRIQKTLEVIGHSFFALRKSCALNEVRVSVICARAKINKTTFYRHYTDVFDLSDKLENAMIADLIATFDGIDCLFTDPDRFIRSLFEFIDRHNGEIAALFRDRVEVFTTKFESIIKARYLSEPVSPEDDIKLSFIIGGAARVFLNDKYNIETNTKALAALLCSIPSPSIKVALSHHSERTV